LFLFLLLLHSDRFLPQVVRLLDVGNDHFQNLRAQVVPQYTKWRRRWNFIFMLQMALLFLFFRLVLLAFYTFSIFLVFMGHCLGFSWFWTKETDTAYIDLNVEYSKAWLGQMVSFSVFALSKILRISLWVICCFPELCSSLVC
jgi:hypothetical protein